MTRFSIALFYKLSILMIFSIRGDILYYFDIFIETNQHRLLTFYSLNMDFSCQIKIYYVSYVFMNVCVCMYVCLYV